MAPLQHLAEIAFLGVLFGRSVWSHRVNLVPLKRPYQSDTNHTRPSKHLGPSAVDLSELSERSDFRDIEELTIQLERGGPKWDFLVEKKTSRKNTFVGRTRNHGARVCFYRYSAKSWNIDLLTGVLQDNSLGLWFEIKPNVNGLSLVTVVADAEMAPFAEPILPPSTSWPEQAALQQPDGLPSIYSSIWETLKEARRLFVSYIPIRISDEINGYDKVASQELTYIDIMVLWTHQAECIKSHLPTNCTVSTTSRQNMKLATLLFLQETNNAFVNSGLKLHLRLAHGQRVNYQESTFAQALEDLQAGQIPDVHQQREQYKADLVMMLMDQNGDFPETGIAYNNFNTINADFMFSVVAVQFTSVWFLPAHELGHNFGCSHDRGTVDMCHDKSRTSYGFREPWGRYRTIMSYPVPPRQCDELNGRSYYQQEKKQICPIIPYYSNNREEGRYDGAVVGGPENNCAAQIAHVQDRIANFY